MRFAFIHLLVVVCIIGKSIYDGYQDYIVDPGNKNVTSHFSHYGGAFAGLLVGIGMLRNFNCSQRKRAFWIICVAIYCATMTFGTLHIHCFRNPITIKINNTNTTNSTTIAKYTLKNVLTTRESEFCKDYEIKLNETKTSLIIFQNNALAYLKNLVPHEKYVSNSTLTNGSNEIIVGNNKTIFITILPIN